MASVRKRPLKRGGHSWVVDYRDPRGRTRTRSFKRKVEAEKFADTVEVSKHRGEWVDPERGRVRYGDWVESWRSHWVGIRPSTVEQRENYLRSLILPTFAHRRLAAIEREEVSTWVKTLADSDLKPSTVHKAHQILSSSLKAAWTTATSSAIPPRVCPCPRSSRRRCAS